MTDFMQNVNELLQTLITSFREVNRAFYHILREEADHQDITPIQLMVLYKLSNNDPTSLGILSEKMQMSNSTMSGVVDRLVHAGLLKRERADDDRRVIVLKLTEAGQNKKDSAFGENSRLINRLSRMLSIPKDDIKKLFDIHQQIISQLETKEDLSKNE